MTNLVVFGTQVAATPNLRVQLGDWGYLIVLEQVAEAPVADGTRNARGAVNALHVVLTADHAGLPAGTEILVGARRGRGVDAGRRFHRDDADDNDSREARTAAGRAGKARKPLPKPSEPGVLPNRPGSVFRLPPTDVSAPLSPAGYVFPVYGPSSFTDTFRAPRAGVGWHHGEDIFAPLGAPLLAVADGTVFSVGWNDRGGYRLWLRDRQGNQFYYAHLSAFSPLAIDGNEVKAGDVVGFVGNTGDAQTTPYHLHFEIHPVGLLPLGYDGVVNALPVPERVAAAGGRHVRRGPRLGAAGAVERDRAPAGSDPARLDRHLQRERPRPRLAGPCADRPGLPGRQRGSRCRLGSRSLLDELVLAGGV